MHKVTESLAKIFRKKLNAEVITFWQLTNVCGVAMSFYCAFIILSATED